MMPFELAEPYTLRDAARLIDADDPSVRAIAAHVVVRMEPKVPQRSSHKPASRPGNKGGGYAGRGAGQCGTLEQACRWPCRFAWQARALEFAVSRALIARVIYV